MRVYLILSLVVLLVEAGRGDELAEQAELLKQCSIRAEQLKPLILDTPLVEENQPRAILCHADDPAWRDAALLVQKAVRETTGVELPLKTDEALSAEDFASNHLVLFGHLENHRWVARLYHNFYVCLDRGFTGRTGYVLRSVHDPFGNGHNAILVGGSFAEGAGKAAQAFAENVRIRAARGNASVGRLLLARFDPEDCRAQVLQPLDGKAKEAAIVEGRRLLFSPGQGRSGISRLIEAGIAYHRSGDPARAEVCHDLFLALEEYYRTDPYINEGGMGRYDRDFRDAFTYQVAIVWDLVEESGLFSDPERLAITNLLVRLALECMVYQRWNTPAAVKRWEANEDIVHNHLTFPALSVYFVGQYLKRHYQVDSVDDWLAVARGIFHGQSLASKPMEDSASYQWLPLIHTMIYSLAEDKLAFFDLGHAREAAHSALMALDNAGYQSAYGDYPALTSASCLAPVLQVAGWYYRSPAFVWGADLAGRGTEYCLGQPYFSSVKPEPPAEHVGVRVSRLPRQCYDFASRNTTKGLGPQLPWEQVFDKLTLRGGWDTADEYLFLDGHGRGNHMHFDVQAIVSYAAGGRPLLVDGEYIKSQPKYHNSLVILRDGQTDPAPAVAGLGRADDFGASAYTRTWVTGYSGADWTRCLLWRRGDYLLVRDEVRARSAGRYTLRCCWRPWGEATLRDGLLQVIHPPMRLLLANADGAPGVLETMKTVEGLAVSRLSQQVSVDLDEGQSYRFLNVVRSEPLEQTGGLAARRIGEDVVVIETPQGCDVAAFQPGDAKLPGVRSDAEVVVLGSSRLMVVGGKSLSADGKLLDAAVPISLELDYRAGTGTIVAPQPGKVELRLPPNVEILCGESRAVADAAGMATLALAAGSQRLQFAASSPPAALTAVHQQLAASPAVANDAAGKAPDLPRLKPVWQCAGIPAPPEKIVAESIHCSIEPRSTYPLERLTDGGHTSSTVSTMWGKGEAPEITVDLGKDVEIAAVVLREWHGVAGWSVAKRQVSLSSDGFQADIRAIDEPFEAVDQWQSGASRNIAMRVPLKGKARQVRIALAPENDQSVVYLSEIEVHALVPGKVSPIAACAAGDLDGDGDKEVVLASAAGQLSAISPAGRQTLWTYEFPDLASIDAVACGDVDGDGKAEVLFGGERARLGLLGGDGLLRWETNPAKFRGIASDVKTVFPADVTGDGRPEVVCGCASWQYFAYDATGTKLWDSVIYAHSATVGAAADLDGDGKAETIAGNAYYTLNVLNPDGRRRWVAGTVTPEMTAVAAGDVDGQPAPEVFCGMDNGDLFCFDGEGKERWRVNLGDKITRIALVDLTSDGIAEIVCAAESAQIVAVEGDGSVLWQAALPAGSADVALLDSGEKPRLVAAAGRAGLVVLDSLGKPVAHAPTGASADHLVLSGNHAVAITGEGRVEVFRMK
ncbi:MAG: PQQ-binding-like beta-propeller repeat protein [Rhodopirellula sp.]|nr:PQQ-binding-like beta-propeller repeat protein [Rhodopirellula sp.]